MAVGHLLREILQQSKRQEKYVLILCLYFLFLFVSLGKVVVRKSKCYEGLLSVRYRRIHRNQSDLL